MSTDPLSAHKRIVIKIGSALLVDAQSGHLRTQWLSDLAADISALRQKGAEIVVVSSGSIVLGRRILGLDAQNLPLDRLQAAASVGQIALSQGWRDAFGAYDVVTGQILITPNITEERRYYLNARTTMHTLLALGAVPIINENDTVATAEIRYGDNDRLSARVASMVEADALVIFSDVDGLYTARPNLDPDARHIPVVDDITPRIEAMAGGAANHLSRGGMATKIEAAKIATQAGTALLIASGNAPHPLKALTEGARHTLFLPNVTPKAARKRWILGALEAAGAVHIDAGAVRALEAGKSLLPIGVTKVQGDFSRGDTVSIIGPDGEELGRGLVAVGKEEADLAKGKHSPAIIGMFGENNRTELIHANDLALLSVRMGEAK